MKQKVIISALFLIVLGTSAYYLNGQLPQNKGSYSLLMENIDALADGENGHSCSASANCNMGSVNEGSVSCTGSRECKSGIGYVTCDGHTSKCTHQGLAD